jgi:hypothetical protein
VNKNEFAVEMIKLEEAEAQNKRIIVNTGIEDLDNENGSNKEDAIVGEADDILSQISFGDLNDVSWKFTSKRKDLLHPIVKIEAKLSHVLAVLQCLMETPMIFSYYGLEQYQDQIEGKPDITLLLFTKVLKFLGYGKVT